MISSLTTMASETNDFALVRPPGHHAYPLRASGFCLFNNIAIAVKKLVNEGKKVAIFDFDGHLGDGYTINVPIPPGSGDDVYLTAVDQIMPIVEQFHPDVVAVSAGFDAHHSDLLLELHLSASGYYRFGQILQEKFSNIFAVLEGGYNLDYLPRCLYNFVNGVNDDNIFFEEEPTDSPIQVVDEFNVRINKLKKNLSQFWKVS